MTLIIKELVIKSTITDKPKQRSEVDDKKMKDEIIKACTNKLKRHFKHINER